MDSIIRNDRMRDRVLHQCAKAGAVGAYFTDGWLAREIGYQRNIVARVRLEVERDGWIERCGTHEPTGETRFRFIPARLELYEMTTKRTDRA
jgi:hypothetical protein